MPSCRLPPRTSSDTLKQPSEHGFDGVIRAVSILLMPVSSSDESGPDGGDETDQLLPLDHHLLEQLHQGDHDAATAIYRRYAERLLRVAERNTPNDLRPRLDPEDVVQSVFRTFFRRATDGAYLLPEGEELWRLLLVIALNKIRRLGLYHRATKRSVSSTSSLPNEAEEPRASEDSARILDMTIDELLAQSPEHARTMIRLRIEGREVAEIAARTQRSKRSVERALQQFRQLLTTVLSAGPSFATGDAP